jgi:hypothetical protein
MYYDRSSRYGMSMVYPPDTKAFLYYSMSSEKPRIAGELRLRVTSSNDAASFESGSDLLRPNGQLWSRPLFNLSKFYPLLYEKLREDRLIPDDLDTVLAALPSKIFRFSRCHLFSTFNDTFIVDFSMEQSNLLVVTEQGVERLTLRRLFSAQANRRERRDCSTTNRPYTGAYTSHHLSILLYWLFSWICRKSLGSTRTFHASRAQRHKDCCVTIAQNNHTCEVCHSPLRWLHMLSKGRRASPETYTHCQ